MNSDTPSPIFLAKINSNAECANCIHICQQYPQNVFCIDQELYSKYGSSDPETHRYRIEFLQNSPRYLQNLSYPANLLLLTSSDVCAIYLAKDTP